MAPSRRRSSSKRNPGVVRKEVDPKVAEDRPTFAPENEHPLPYRIPDGGVARTGGRPGRELRPRVQRWVERPEIILADPVGSTEYQHRSSVARTDSTMAIPRGRAACAFLPTPLHCSRGRLEADHVARKVDGAIRGEFQ